MKEFKLNLVEQEVNLVLQALADMPAKLSMSLILKLQVQIQAQLKQDNIVNIKKPKE